MYEAARMGNIVRIPMVLRDEAKRLKKQICKLTQEKGRSLTNQEIAEKTNIPIEKVEWFINQNSPDIALDAPIREGEFSNYEREEDTKNIPADIHVLRIERIEFLISFMREKFDERTVDVMIRRYGLNGGAPETYAQIGQTYNVCRERISQLDKDALKKLKHPVNRKKLECLL